MCVSIELAVSSGRVCGSGELSGGGWSGIGLDGQVVCLQPDLGMFHFDMSLLSWCM